MDSAYLNALSEQKNVEVFYNEIVRLYTERNAAQARIAELEADKARLDWLETDLTYTFPVQDPKLKTWWIYGIEGEGDVEDQPSLRAAIDAGMKPGRA